MLKKHPHTPAHLFLDDTLYFVTGAIYQKRDLLQNEGLKQLVYDRMCECFSKYGWELQHWVILDNHYHLMGRSRQGKDLSRIFQGIHGGTSAAIQQATGASKPIWWNYWDYCPRDERDYHIRVNYLLWNPAKHGYVERLADYAYSSYHQLVREKGVDEVESRFRAYPEYKNYVLREVVDADF